MPVLVSVSEASNRKCFSAIKEPPPPPLQQASIERHCSAVEVSAGHNITRNKPLWSAEERRALRGKAPGKLRTGDAEYKLFLKCWNPSSCTGQSIPHSVYL